MKNINEMKEWIIKEIGFLPVDDEDGVEFYYTAMHDYDMGLTDADDYAWLNTLFGYDICADHALEIIRWYYENLDTTIQDAVSIDQMETLRNICEMELGFHLDFSNWPTEEPKYFRYDFD